MTGWPAVVGRLITPLPPIGGLAEDRLVIRPGHWEPVCLVRTLPPDYAAICAAIHAGQIQSLPEYGTDALLEALGRLDLGPGSLSGKPRLRLVR